MPPCMGTLSFGTLWTLDNQSRMLIPNSVFVGVEF